MTDNEMISRVKALPQYRLTDERLVEEMDCAGKCWSIKKAVLGFF